MKLAGVVLALVLAAPAPAAEIVSERPFTDRGLELTIDTPSFTEPTRVQVFLPAEYDAKPRRRWPVTYYLAGTNHDERSFQGLYDGEVLTRELASIVVAPKGDAGYWSDWYNGGAFGPPMYETYVVDELLPLIEERFRAAPRRALMGESMGGYGVMTLAARHPDLFVAASSHSGALNSNLPVAMPVLSASSTLQGGAYDAINGPRSTQEVRWRGRNPWDLAGNLREVSLQVRTGSATPRDDEIVDPVNAGSCALELVVRDTSRSFHERLLELGVDHTWVEYDRGCHSPTMFKQEIHDALPAFAQSFAVPRRRPAAFSHVAIEPSFDVWGWTFVADPERALEFLRVEDAGRRGVTLAGSGTTAVTTAPLFRGLRKVDVGTAVVAPDRRGRLSFSVDLGEPHTVQAYTAGAPETAVRGTVQFAPHARVVLSQVSPAGFCARTLGGRVVARVAGRYVRLAARPRCVRARVERAVVVRGRDQFGHRVRARAAVKRQDLRSRPGSPRSTCCTPGSAPAG